MTLTDLIRDLINAKTPKDKDRIYRLLARVGMDKYTADILAEELKKGE